MNLLLSYATALLLGSVHALEADHMAAVTAFVVRRPVPLAAARFGIRWAAGHGLAILAAGLLLMFLGVAIPDSAAPWLDRGVGVVLIALGAWTAWHASLLHAHVSRGRISSAHLHSHVHHQAHQHSASPGQANTATVIGTLHGLAGAAPALAMLQIARLDSVVAGMAYLTTFAVGTALGMAVYALVTGYLFGRAALASERWARWLGRFSGIGTIVIGIYLASTVTRALQATIRTVRSDTAGYRAAWDQLRDEASRLNVRAWLFAAADEPARYIEFLEWQRENEHADAPASLLDRARELERFGAGSRQLWLEPPA